MSAPRAAAFEESVWEGGSRLEPGRDLARLNAAADARLLAQLEAVAGDGRSRCLLLLGQPGLGKSHVLARVATQARERAFGVVVRQYDPPHLIFRKLFREVAWGLAEARLAGGLSALEAMALALVRALMATFPTSSHALPPAVREGPLDQAGLAALRHFLVAKESRLGDRGKLFLSLAKRFGEVVRERLGARGVPAYSEEAVLALLALARPEPDLPGRAMAWLAGRDLAEEDLAALGFTRALDDEGRAREAFAALALAARLTRPLAIAFDQTERLESSPDETGIDALGRVVATLRELPAVSLVFACLKDRWFHAYARTLPSSYRDRIAAGPADVVELAYPDPDEALELLRLRLGGALAPFDEANVRAWTDRFQPSPRELFQHARTALLGSGSGPALLPLDPAPGPVAAPADPAAEARAEWRAVLAVTPESGALDAGGVEGALGSLLADADPRVEGVALVQVRPERGSAIPFLLQAGRRRIGLVADDTASGTGFVRRLRAVLGELDRQACDHLVWWRTAPVKESWKKGAELFAELCARPDVTVRSPGAGTLRRLEAYRRLASGLAAQGRDARETARHLFPVLVEGAPELAELAGILGLGEAAGPGSGPAPLAPEARALRELVRGVLFQRKVLHEARLAELVRAERPVDDAVLAAVLADFEAERVLLRLKCRGDGHVLALR